MTIVDLPCDDASATLEQYADAVRTAFPDDLDDVVSVGYSFGGFTATRIAVEHPELPVGYIAAWIPRPGALVLDLFMGGDPFAAGDEAAGIAAFGGLVVSAGPGRCALNIEQQVAAADPSERDAVRAYLERTQRLTRRTSRDVSGGEKLYSPSSVVIGKGARASTCRDGPGGKRRSRRMWRRHRWWTATSPCAAGRV